MTGPTLEELDDLCRRFDSVYAEINSILDRLQEWERTLEVPERALFRETLDRPDAADAVAKLPDGDFKRFAKAVFMFAKERA